MNLMKNQMKQKFQNFKILKKKAARQNIDFKNHLMKQLCLMDSKILALNTNHMCMK
jgi:hypothetical protein